MPKFEVGNKLGGRKPGSLNRSTEQAKLTIARSCKLSFSAITPFKATEPLLKRYLIRSALALLWIVEFSSPDGTQYARFEAELDQGSSGNLENSIADFETNRYFVITKQLQDLYTSANFTWNAVTVVKIYACVLSEDSGPSPVPSSDYYIALDALRLENTSSNNPLYGMTGYTVVKNTDGETIIKPPNTSNYVEFRFSIGVT